MEIEVLERPAALSIWRTDHLARPPVLVHFPSLKEAITSAALTLLDSDVQPWIVTDEGEMLSPNWIRTYVS